MIVHTLVLSPAPGLDHRHLRAMSQRVVVNDLDGSNDVDAALELAYLHLRRHFGGYFVLDSHEKKMVQG